MITALMAFSLALLVFCLMALVMLAFSRDRILFTQRLQALLGQEKLLPLVRQRRQKRTRLPVSRAFAEDLMSAGIRMRPEEFMTIWFGLTFVPALLLMLLGAHAVTSIGAALIGVVIPPAVVLSRRGKRLILFEKQLGDALLLMGNCLRSGLTFQQAMANIAHEMPDPIAREFARTVREIQLGNSVDDALNAMVHRVRSTDLMLTVSAVQIQRQVGGNMLEILENISGTIKERLKLKDDIRVMTATGRTSGLVVGMIPLGIGGLLMLINPGYVMTFFDTTLGIVMLVVAGVMEIIGFMVIKKIVTIKY